MGHAEAEALQFQAEPLGQVGKLRAVHVALDRLDRGHALKAGDNASLDMIAGMENEVCVAADLVNLAGNVGQPRRDVRVRENRYSQLNFLLLVTVGPAPLLALVLGYLLSLFLLSAGHCYPTLSATSSLPCP